jgi:hypothetical protein
VDTLSRWSGRLWLVGSDGRWGMTARARGGGKGPIRGGRGVGRGSPGAIHVLRLSGVKPAMGAGTSGRRWCRSGRRWATHRSGARGGGSRGSPWLEVVVHVVALTAAR